jgi:phytoene dehydrogenase-like protein
MNRTVDFIVIGAGINGLVAAAELAGAGWSVALIDEQERIGGFIASDEVTEPGYVHDTHSSWHPLFVGSAAYAALGADLHRHGLAYSITEGAVTASVSRHGAVIADRNVESTAAASSTRRILMRTSHCSVSSRHGHRTSSVHSAPNCGRAT